MARCARVRPARPGGNAPQFYVVAPSRASVLVPPGASCKVNSMGSDPSGALRIAVAALCGAAVGIEREWSGHATGPMARIGGVRTFTLLAALAGMAGWLWSLGDSALGAVLLAGGVALVVAGYIAM